jgi:hypothetical protein
MSSLPVQILSYASIAMVVPLLVSVVLHDREGAAISVFVAVVLWLSAWAMEFHDIAVRTAGVSG